MSDLSGPTLDDRANRGRSIMDIWRASWLAFPVALMVTPFIVLYADVETPDYIQYPIPYMLGALFLLLVFGIRIAVLELKSNATIRDVFESFVLVGAIIIALIGFYAIIYQHYGLLNDTTPVTSPSDFLYFSIVTWTTLGYGDLKPTAACRLFAASEALLGYIAMELYLTLVFHAMSGRRQANS
jgi:hypothetical protein